SGNVIRDAQAPCGIMQAVTPRSSSPSTPTKTCSCLFECLVMTSPNARAPIALAGSHGPDLVPWSVSMVRSGGLHGLRTRRACGGGAPLAWGSRTANAGAAFESITDPLGYGNSQNEPLFAEGYGEGEERDPDGHLLGADMDVDVQVPRGFVVAKYDSTVGT